MKVTVTATRSLSLSPCCSRRCSSRPRPARPRGKVALGQFRRSASAPTFDGDGNGLFDDLEARLAKLSDDSKVDVLVKLNASATASRVGDLSSRLGGFATGRRFGIVDGFSATMTKAQAERLARLPVGRARRARRRGARAERHARRPRSA